MILLNNANRLFLSTFVYINYIPMKRLYKILKRFFLGAAIFTVLLALVVLLLYWTRDSRDLDFLDRSEIGMESAPEVVVEDTVVDGRIQFNRFYGACRLVSAPGNNILLYAEGSPYDIGNAIGKLAPDLLYYQEKVFINRIKEMIPSDSYLAFLRVMLGVFNRNLASNIPDEYKREIYAMAQHCTDEFDIIGTPYDRQLNYHAAHDIGHAMQRYMLVGCSSFGVWSSRAECGKMLIGRNFDFYMGDEFAKNRLITVIRPQNGFGYISVAWPGMIGVLSGMNEKGLTVTLNAAQGDIPRSSATPVSILAREILQYASNIEEAVEIAGKYRTFTSEQFLIGSASDGICATIEKSPDKMDIVYGANDYIINTNHFSGKVFESDKWNVENIEKSDSRYRYERIAELIDEKGRLCPEAVAAVLRDRYGMSGKDIGYTNQKSVNQLIAHHSVIFEPEEKNIWIAGGKGWQYGEFIHLNLDSLMSEFSHAGSGNSSSSCSVMLPGCGVYDIPEDTLFFTAGLDNILEYRKLVNKLLNGEGSVDIERMISLNPHYYKAWVMAAGYLEKRGEAGKALEYYGKALSMEVATEWEKEEIEENIVRLQKIVGKGNDK